MGYNSENILRMAQRMLLRPTITPIPGATITPGHSDQEVKLFSAWGKSGSPHLRLINQNTDSDKDPFEGLSEGNKRELLAYVVYYRQNAAMPANDSPNIESAKDIIEEEASFKNERELDKHLVKQLTKAKGIGLRKTLKVDSKGKVVVDSEDPK